ncbi:unnamed protein product, partial [Pylaiella littoralis]
IYGANRVITSVNSKTKGSSCSRPNCHTVNHAHRSRAQVAEPGGAAVTAASVKGCDHARAGFTFIGEHRTKKASKVGFGGPNGVSIPTV